MASKCILTGGSGSEDRDQALLLPKGHAEQLRVREWKRVVLSELTALEALK